ncbi:uncharacterized protein LOC124681254 [Lolium rigidum]|uniref:uncharacterized protein LOC124681254 n=1 Tax=Lolium rigidum TaxID=89674 RepID=UPI001F5D22FF|nr:uncharacterized protein LOC124681254 [Lolium rigidum]
MRKPTPFLFLNDVSTDFLVDGDLGACPGAGLCWPDDSLDNVLGYVSMLDDGFLHDLGLDFSLPESRRLHDGSDYAGRPQDHMKPYPGPLAAALCEPDAPGARMSGACHVLDSVPGGQLPQPPPQAPSFSCSQTSSGRRSLSPTSEPQASDEDDLRWTVLRRPHQRRAARRRHGWPTWTLALPLALIPPAAAHDDDGNDRKDKDFELASCCDIVGGGGNDLPLPRPPGAGQKRPRKQAGSKNNGKVVGKTCTHCRASDTPQWRAGPDGNGTLCNACGIRYKMGKLFPEYRPSNSPEFSSNEHSNRHRNVERIRQRKKLKVMAPEVPLNPEPHQPKLLLPLPVCKYETS